MKYNRVTMKKVDLIAYCRERGLPSVAVLEKISGVSHRTLYNWARDKPEALECLTIGAADIYARQSRQEGHQESDSP